MRKSYFAALAALVLSPVLPSVAEADEEVQAMKAEIQALQKAYESRITELELKLAKIEKLKTSEQSQPTAAPASVHSKNRNIYDNRFNPSIGLILNGRYGSFSKDSNEIAGFAVGEEGERGKEGFAIDESELNFSSNIDDKFYGSVTAAIVREEGEAKIELEEAYIQTLPGMGLPKGMNIKLGRAFWTLGYLNEHHSHADDFADRPLPNRVFLNNTFNDDGVEVSYLLPTDFYSEIGGGAFRGDDYPFGGADDSGFDAWSAFARLGGDIGENQNWRLGGYVLSGEVKDRASNEDIVHFSGDTRLFATDLRYTWAPTGNPRETEILLQGEYFWRNEEGAYSDTDAATGSVPFDEHSDGWYLQGVYKFLPQWRIGYRYSRLDSPSVPVGLVGSALDSDGHNPTAHALMADWTNSEFSRLRLQYNHERTEKGGEDDQILLQYVMSIGAHGAHKY
jgi:hypothetical protein